MGKLGAMNDRSRSQNSYLIFIACCIAIVFYVSTRHGGSFQLPRNLNSKQWILETERIREQFIAKRQQLFTADSPDSTLLWDNDEVLYIWHFIAPTFTCPHFLERVGRASDGGKWICGVGVFEFPEVSKDCVIYSFGAGKDSSFEREMLERTRCQVYLYDHTVELPNFGKTPMSQDVRDRLRYFRLGIGTSEDTSKNDKLRTLKELMAENGHEWIDFLKVDIESEEYRVLSDIGKDFPETFPFGHLNLEMHLHPHEEKQKQKEVFKELMGWWGMLENHGLRALTWEDNHIASFTTHKPTLMEYTFINVKDGRNKLLMF